MGTLDLAALVRGLRMARRLSRRGVAALRGRAFNPRISPTAIIERRDLVRISASAQVTEYVVIRAHAGTVEIGDFSQLGPFCVILGGSGVRIGDNVMIGPHCTLAAGNHDFKQTAKPMRHAGSISSGPIIIEDDVWIGANVTITDGVRVGRGAVVAANSAVTKNVVEYAIVGGVPARPIGSRRTPGGGENDG